MDNQCVSRTCTQNRFEARSHQHDSTPLIGCVPAASGGKQWHAHSCGCATRCSGRERQQVSVQSAVLRLPPKGRLFRWSIEISPNAFACQELRHPMLSNT